MLSNYIPSQETKSIGVILPHSYSGGTLRLFKSVCSYFSRFDSINVVVAVPKTGYHLTIMQEWLESQNSSNIRVCEFEFVTRTPEQTATRLQDAGVTIGELISKNYIEPVDTLGMLADCYHWFFMSDRILGVLIPLRPYSIFVTDHLHRYFPGIFVESEYCNQDSVIWDFQRNIRNADLCIASTDGTFNDVLSFSGSMGKVIKVPIGADVRYFQSLTDSLSTRPHRSPYQFPYFIWVTNTSHHKNHLRSIEALEIFFKNNTELHVVVVGSNTDLFSPTSKIVASNDRWHAFQSPYIAKVRKAIKSTLDKHLNRIHFSGEVSDVEYVDILRNAKFLWHNVIADNGTYSVIEAACLGVPSISSNYPQMVEIAKLAEIDLEFFDPFDIEDTARSLLKGPGKDPIDQTAVANRLRVTEHDMWTDELLTSVNEVSIQNRTIKYL